MQSFFVETLDDLETQLILDAAGRCNIGYMGIDIKTISESFML